jgi:nicotinamidase-related amidase
MRKSVNSAFIGTALEAWLRERGIEQVIIAGLTPNHGVETTTRMAGNPGVDALLVGDACATHDRTGPDVRHQDADTLLAASLASLHVEFATVVSTDEVLSAR